MGGHVRGGLLPQNASIFLAASCFALTYSEFHSKYRCLWVPRSSPTYFFWHGHASRRNFVSQPQPQPQLPYASNSYVHFRSFLAARIRFLPVPSLINAAETRISLMPTRKLLRVNKAETKIVKIRIASRAKLNFPLLGVYFLLSAPPPGPLSICQSLEALGPLVPHLRMDSFSKNLENIYKILKEQWGLHGGGRGLKKIRHRKGLMVDEIFT